MRKNNLVLAVTVSLMAAALSSSALGKGSQGSGFGNPNTAMEYCMLSGGKMASNKHVVACCVGGQCVICGKKTNKCVTRKQGRARVIDLVRRPSAITPGPAAQTGKGRIIKMK